MQDQQAVWNRIHESGGRDRLSQAKPNEFCLRLESLLRSDSKVLEIGCGLGIDAAYLASRGFEVVAIDLSSSSIDICRSQFHGSEHLVFEQHDAVQPFDLTDGGVDAVYARLSLQYFFDQDTRAIFRELARVLPPGGILAFMCKSVEDPLYGLGAEIAPDVFDSHHLRHFFSEAYARQCLDGLFSIESLSSHQGLLYDSPSAWIEVIARR